MGASAAFRPGDDAWQRAAFQPLVVFPLCPLHTADARSQLSAVIQRHLPRSGAILLRGFRISEDRDFEQLVTGLTSPAATGAPRLWAWYAAVPRAGEHVALADAREIRLRLPPRLRRSWDEGRWRVELGARSAGVARTDGAALDPLDEHELRGALDACVTPLPWESRDVLLLDTGLTLHRFQPGSVGSSVIVRHAPQH